MPPVAGHKHTPAQTTVNYAKASNGLLFLQFYSIKSYKKKHYVAICFTLLANYLYFCRASIQWFATIYEPA